ncbi:hypothetical protein [Streptomyces erythrochromogenes]|uniref:hypothetical protein n=1 Tax=Streptomyces erythrochromogenes TaxID=285574 RepID=UPI002250F0BC|nr:hypothetical protein [Streptomyces erythrochromogenes]MCX5585829.1 hypothetical protein [Streptomyces erythrochromogenes]
MRPHIRKAVREMEQAIEEQRWEDAADIGIATYSISDGKERELLETYLGPNAAKRAGLKH